MDLCSLYLQTCNAQYIVLFIPMLHLVTNTFPDFMHTRLHIGIGAIERRVGMCTQLDRIVV